MKYNATRFIDPQIHDYLHCNRSEALKSFISYKIRKIHSRRKRIDFIKCVQKDVDFILEEFPDIKQNVNKSYDLSDLKTVLTEVLLIVIANPRKNLKFVNKNIKRLLYVKPKSDDEDKLPF